MTKSEKQYLWIRDEQNLPPQVVTDLNDLYKHSLYDPQTDKLYEIGPEVKLELTLKVIPAKPVVRENASGYRTTFENRD